MFVTGTKWMWPICETLHFVGLSLLMGVVLLVDLRMLGFMKSVSFPVLHRLLPWGILGFGMNVMTGLVVLYRKSRASIRTAFPSNGRWRWC